jgi:hypothetical protein
MGAMRIRVAPGVRPFVALSLVVATGAVWAQQLDFHQPGQLLTQAARLARAGQRTPARRAVVAWLQTTPVTTRCPETRPLIDHTSAVYFFPAGRSTEFAVSWGNIVQFMRLRGGRVSIVYEASYGAITAGGQRNFGSAVLAFVNASQRSSAVVSFCGALPSSGAAYTSFDSQTPPGIVDVGVVRPSGAHRVLGTHSLEDLPYALPVVDAP